MSSPFSFLLCVAPVVMELNSVDQAVSFTSSASSASYVLELKAYWVVFLFF